MKKCRVCKLDRESHWFRSRIRKGSLVYEKTCTQCCAKRGNDQHRNKRYDMPKPFEEMVKEQDGLCKLCKKEPQSKGLNVDHCHTTGRVRGLLCTNCNAGLGFFNEDVELLKAAIEYLSK